MKLRVRPTHRHSLSNQLRGLIDSRGMRAYAVAGVDPGIVRRFVRGTRGLSLETADKIAGALDPRLVETARRTAPRRTRPHPNP